MGTLTVKQVIKKLEYIYGEGIGYYPDSPYEGNPKDSAELVIHELCHQVFVGLGATVNRMAWSFDEISRRLDRLPKWLADLHEVKTIAAELLVAQELGLRFASNIVTLAGYKNTESTVRWTHDRFKKAVRVAQRTPSVKFAAAQVVELVKADWSNPPGSKYDKSANRSKAG